MNTDVIDFPPIVDAPRADVAVAAPAALDLRKIDLTDVALSKFGDWRKETADTKAELDKLALDLSTQARIDEAVSLRHRKINAPLALARKASAGLKSKLTSVSKSVGAELEAIESAWADVATAITPQIEAAQKKIDAEREEKARIERERVAALEAKLAGLSSWSNRCKAPDMTSQRIALGIEALKTLEFVEADWAEFLPRALARKAEVLDVMADMGHAALAREMEAARLEAQRLENERVAAELAEQQRLLAEQAAELQRKVEALAEQERAAAQARAEKEAAEAAAARQAEAKRIDADGDRAAAESTSLVGWAPPAQQAQATDAECDRTRQLDTARDRLWAESGIPIDADDYNDYIPPSSTVDEPRAQTEAEIQAANGPEVELPPEIIDARPPRVTGSPDQIWLVYGELEHDDTHAEVYESGIVAWCQDKQFDSDVRYVRADIADAEIDRLRDLLHRMLEAPTTSIRASWKDAIRQALAGERS